MQQFATKKMAENDGFAGNPSRKASTIFREKTSELKSNEISHKNLFQFIFIKYSYGVMH